MPGRFYFPRSLVAARVCGSQQGRFPVLFSDLCLKFAWFAFSPYFGFTAFLLSFLPDVPRPQRTGERVVSLGVSVNLRMNFPFFLSS